MGLLIFQLCKVTVRISSEGTTIPRRFYFTGLKLWQCVCNMGRLLFVQKFRKRPEADMQPFTKTVKTVKKSQIQLRMKSASFGALK